MKFWKFSTQAVAALLASTVVSASGPADGEAAADPNSAVVKLTAKAFKSFLDENPLVLTEFFAPWCGYCKQLGPEFARAADTLNETHSNIKLAQVDCTEEEELCQQHLIGGYPTLKVMRGPHVPPEDYQGPRDAEGIVDYMIKQALPPVQKVSDADAFVAHGNTERKPFMVQVFPSAAAAFTDRNNTFGELAITQRQYTAFFSVEDDDVIAALDKQVSADLANLKEPAYLVVHPNEWDDVRVFDGEFTKDNLQEFSTNAKVPHFGDINRDTYLIYMSSLLPLGYYFYNAPEQREAVDKFFHDLGKKHNGVINFVGLDASQFGRHAETLNMNPDVVPLFAIQDNSNGRKYGINQTLHPDGPSIETISEFIEKYLAGEIEPIIRSEPLPTEEEIASQAVVKLVAHNYDAALNDTTKDVFVKYYAPWCGHCKKLAPIWEEMAEIFGSSSGSSKVVIADVDYTLNDVDTPILIEGYPTLILYPANAGVDERTGMRKHVLYDNARDLESLLAFIKNKGGLGIDGEALKSGETVAEEDEGIVEELDHDEL